MAQPKEIAALQRFVGKWKVKIVARMPDGTQSSGEGTLLAEPICSDFGVRTSLKAKLEKMGDFEEHDLWGFDRHSNQLHFYSITSTGNVHDHVGKLAEGGSMNFRWKGLREGKNMIEDISFEFRSAKEIHAHEVDTVDGKPGPAYDYFMTRA